MSTTIDERVVSMQFDNKRFESNVQTSLNTIDKLKQSLNFTGASKGLDNISTAAKNVNFSGMSGAIDTVRMKFSALEVMAVTALANITNNAVNAGKRLVSAFTIDPIKTGLSEYETQVNAVQTILANTESKGTTLDDVNAALDTLNAYADKTIYNFTEMTRNIGTFTAAGVDLDTSVNAIQGIANLAAISGSNSQQASTAMYQLSQALASGTVKLMDWNSVVNAGMGGQVFQDALKETARVHGIAIDKMIEENGSFRETLQEGWLTADILTETLMKFTMSTEGLTEAQIEQNRAMLKSLGYTDEQIEGIFKLGNTATNAATKVKTFTQLMDTLKESAQSGWTQTWEIIIGDFEQAKELWTVVSDTLGGIISASADARNKLLGGALSESTWGEFSTKIEEAGLTMGDFEESVRNIAKEHGQDLDALIEKYGSFENAVKSGAFSTDILKKSLDGLKKTGKSADLSGINRTLRFGESGEDVRKLEAALKTLGYDLLGHDGKDYGHGDDGFFGTITEEAIRDFQKLHGLKVTGMVDEATLAALDEACNKAEKLDESVYDLIDGLGNLGGRQRLIDGISSGFNAIKNIIVPIKDAFREIFPPTTAEQLFAVVDGFANFAETFEAWTTSTEGAAVISNIASAFRGFFSVIDIGWTLVKTLAGGLIDLIGSLLGFGSGIAGIAGSIGNWLTGLRNSIKETNIFATVINGVVGFLQNGIKAIQGFFSSLGQKMSTPGWDGFFALLKGIWSFIQSIGKAISNFGSAIGSIFMSGGFGEIISLANGGLFAMLLMNISKFFKGITSTVESGGGLFESIKDTLGGLKDILDNVGEALTAWTQNIKSNILLKIAAAIGILAVSLMLLASIKPEKLSSALAAITVLFGELMFSLKLFSKTGVGEMKGVTKAVTAMIGISAAVLILATALKKISSLGWEELARGLVGIIALTGTIVLAVKALSTDGKQAVKGATQMVILAAAVKILASACKDLSSMSWEELAKGLVGVGVLMAEIAIFMRTAKFDGKSILAATGIVILSGAIKILASACADFGSMSWDEIGKGLAAVGALLLELAVFTKLTGNAKHVISTGVALIAIGAAMKIFTSAMIDIAALSWEQVGKGLVGLAGALVSVAVATRLMPKNLIGTGAGLVVVGAAMLILADAMNTMGNMSWESIGKGMTVLGGSMLILAIGLNVMKSTLAGSAALLVASAALVVLANALSTMGSMSWESIGKSLAAIAGAFILIGVAGAVLGPIVPVILGLAGAMALLGVGMLAVGAGVLALGVGISALGAGLAVGATAIVSGLTAIILAIAELIPDLMKALGRGVVEFCKAIGDSAGAIGEAFKDVLLALVDVFVDCVPPLVEGLLVLIDELLKSLAAHTPAIVESVVKVLFGVFEGVANAMKGLDVGILTDGLIGIGVISAVIVALSVIAGFIPGALVGALGMAAVVAELALVLAAIGALAQIPGLQWLVGEGGKIMQGIGNALGKFVGGIVGGIAEGITASLPQIGTDLSAFMTNLQPFIDGASKIDSSMMDGVESIVDIILQLTAANILEGLTAWFTGGSSLTKFGEELVPFGESLASFSRSVTGLDHTAIVDAICAASSLISVASTIPNTGGIISWFTGDNKMDTFGSQLGAFGTGIASFASAVSGINADSVTTAANAASTLITAASGIPNSGGIISWFTGDQSLDTFGSQLGAFGTGIASFASAVSGINTDSVTAAITAAESLITVSSTIPNTGGIISWFTGDNSMESFGNQLGSFGKGIKAFATSVDGVKTESVTAAITAAESLITISSTIPNSGGIISWFTGDNSLASFSTQMESFGNGIKAFATAVSGVNMDSVSTAATAASTLITAASTIPNSGGIISWFTGDNTLATFSTQLGSFGEGIKAFATSVAGVNTESVTAAITAAQSLISVASTIPSSGGIIGWFTGDSSLETFGTQLGSFGTGIASFATAVSGVNTESVGAAATAASTLITAASQIPSSGGVISWFTGEQSLDTFAGQLGSFGGGIKAFATAVTGINTESVTTAANAASTLITAASQIPSSGGIIGWFTGDQSLDSFGDQLGSFGSGIKAFSDSVVGINTEAVTAASKVASDLSTIASSLPESKSIDNMKKLGEKAKDMGKKLKEFADEVAGITWTNVSSANTELNALATTMAAMPTSFDGAESFSTALEDLSSTSIDDFVKAFTDAKTRVIAAGEGLITDTITGINNKKANLTTAVTSAAKAASSAISVSGGSIDMGFRSAGRFVVDGFVKGVSANLHKARKAGLSIGRTALEGTQEALDEHSPSREYYQVGVFAGVALVNALHDYERQTYEAGYGVGESAKYGLSAAISKMRTAIESDIDTQPTIRPVLDLSDVTAGAGAINRMLDMRSSVGVTSRFGAINSMMNKRQNGSNDDVISAINSLGKKISTKTGDTYNVGNVGYEDGSTTANAVKSLVHAVKMERRT